MTTPDPRHWMWNQALSMIERAEQLHRRFIEPGGNATCWQPPVDIFETDSELWIIAALPGVDSGDLSVSIEGGHLRMTGQRRLPRSARAAEIRRLEIPRGHFERSIRLPDLPLTLDHSELANGCLVIRLAKA